MKLATLKPMIDGVQAWTRHGSMYLPDVPQVIKQDLVIIQKHHNQYVSLSPSLIASS
jgi:hypothetical protein